MKEIIQVKKEHLETLTQIATRMMLLSNSIRERNTDISFDVMWSNKPNYISVWLYKWCESGIESSERSEWNFDHDDSEKQKENLLKKISEWELKYGLE